tara:strand:- start:6756 stop:7541 length:786 start_codon:yes stop_codon:yes gene_type:complete
MRILFTALTFLMFTFPALAGMPVNYQDGNVELQGYVAAPETNVETAPIVMIVHQWKGLGDYEKKRADMLADLGYVAFAIDMYGEGIRPETTEAAGKESGKYKNNPDLARGRLSAALTAARNLNIGDENQIAVMGYCFGGTMALELARMGADVDGVVSFHGGLGTESPAKEDSVIPEIIVHHGAADPHVPPEQVNAFMKEMEPARPDFTFYSYADAVHAFTEKEAGNDPSTGVAYNAQADQKSWARTLAFFERIFAENAKPD